ncbi:MAG: CHAP domain-containing protein [Rhodospirillum sp.]|nr:CHAP domain-containing protein [Rhodospirillum sp.]MCF8488324.1 CHAP domain-containing protein [Rhodospirillum sp.]MCF8500745.1 CHAP domain-containing protein [Rhodospirillum sp.]
MRFRSQSATALLAIAALTAVLLTSLTIPAHATNSGGPKTGPFTPSFLKDGPTKVSVAGLHIEANKYWSCVPFVKAVSTVQLSGDGWRWWENAQGRYKRGHAPKEGSVLVFKRNKGLSRGHVALVREVVDERTVRLDHANWGTGSQKGKIDLGVIARDVSIQNDWSAVRVWYSPINDLGSTAYPVYGFVYQR